MSIRWAVLSVVLALAAGCGTVSVESAATTSTAPASVSGPVSTSGSSRGSAARHAGYVATLKIGINANGGQDVQGLREELASQNQGLFVSIDPVTGDMYVYASTVEDVAVLESLQRSLSSRRGITSVTLEKKYGGG